MNNFDARLAELVRHRKLDKRRGEGPLARPFIIEILGPQRSGKTTAIRELDKLFRGADPELKVYAPQENAQAIRNIGRTTALYNLRTMMYSLEIVIDQWENNVYDCIILDRGPFDGHMFMGYCRAKGMLNDEEMRIFQAVATSRFWINKIDAACLMVCDPEVAMGREKRVALSDKTTSSTNLDIIGRLIALYKKTYDELSPLHPQLQWFDTTNMNEQEGTQAVTEHIISCLMKKLSK